MTPNQLPPLPLAYTTQRASLSSANRVSFYTAVQMHAYALAALAQQAQGVGTAALKDHQIAAMVSKLRDIAREFHAHDSLRDRIANEIVPALKAAPVVPDGFAIVPVEPTPEMWQAVDQFAHAGSVWDAMLAASQQKGGQ